VCSPMCWMRGFILVFAVSGALNSLLKAGFECLLCEKRELRSGTGEKVASFPFLTIWNLPNQCNTFLDIMAFYRFFDSTACFLVFSSKTTKKRII